MNKRFRITHWPGDPVPVPLVDVPNGVERDGWWLVFTRSGDWRGTYRELPREFYLREARELDVTDLDAVAAFVAQHGYVAPRWELNRDLPPGSDVAIQRQAATAGHGRYQRTGAKELRDGWQRIHVDEVIFRIRVLRALTGHAIAYREGDYEYTAWPDHAEWPAEEDGEAEAWRRFTTYTDPALRPFHVRVWADADDPDFDIGRPRPTVYEAAVLQLVNDLAEQVDYRPCAHCGRVFVRQVGRSTQRSRMQGVAYCTPECSRAAGVKAFRARERVKRQKEAGHGKRRKET